MMDFVTVEKGKIMAEYITCRRCDSPDCKGCNLKRLETMLENGKFDCLMNENRAIDTSADVATVRHGRWEPVLEGVWNLPTPVLVGWRCSQCGRTEQEKEPYCNCGARMDGDDNA